MTTLTFTPVFLHKLLHQHRYSAKENGVLFKLEDHVLQVVSTNNRLLTVTKLTMPEIDTTLNATIHNRGVMFIKGYLRKLKGLVSLSFSESYVDLKQGESQIDRNYLVGETYPDYTAVIQKEVGYQIWVRYSSFKDAVQSQENELILKEYQHRLLINQHSMSIYDSRYAEGNAVKLSTAPIPLDTDLLMGAVLSLNALPNKHLILSFYEDSINVGLELEGRPETKVIIAANH